MTDRSAGEALVLAETVGGVAVATLNRPKALNALSLDMVRQLSRMLRDWADDPRVHGVLLRGAPRLDEQGRPAGHAHFCAGGDIRFLHHAALSGDLSIDDFFTEEYALDHFIHRYPKPVVAWMEGVTMGGGMGLAQGASLRVVTETTRLAMPETRIGLFPDVGGGYFLSRCPGHVGEYLGVVGPHMNASDALAFGLANVSAWSGQLDEVLDLFRQQPAVSSQDVVARFQAALAAQPPLALPAPVLAAERARIDQHFSQPTLEEIEASLQADPCDWAQQTLGQMAGHSPLMMHVTLEQIRRARTMPLADVFRMERGIVRHCFNDQRGARSETVEGVRALAIDKDQQPRWRYTSLAEVPPQEVALFFDSPWPSSAHPLRDLA